MKLTISNYLQLYGHPMELEKHLTRLLTIQNPRWLDNEKMNRWQGNTARFLTYFHTDGLGTMSVPRGLAVHVWRWCKDHGAEVEVEDKRASFPGLNINFMGRGLRQYQVEAAEAVLKRDAGVLCAPTGSGKTVMALYLIAKRDQPTVIVVHTKDLANQWIDRIGQFLGIDAGDIGLIGAGKKTVNPNGLNVALVQTLYGCADEIASHIGHLVVDECHRAPSRTFNEAVTAFSSKYILGLTATPFRRDKMTNLIYWFLGDQVHKIEPDGLREDGHILTADVVVRKTDFKAYSDPKNEYAKMLSELSSDLHRNRMIVQDVADIVNSEEEGVCLVLSDRKEHCEILKSAITTEKKIPAVVLTGDTPNKQREMIIDMVNRGAVPVVVATGQLIGEGFDCKNLTNLFLAMPIKFSGRLIQYLGRVLRPAPGKERALIYDYEDAKVGVLRNSASGRRRVYRQNGFSITREGA